MRTSFRIGSAAAMLAAMGVPVAAAAQGEARCSAMVPRPAPMCRSSGCTMVQRAPACRTELRSIGRMLKGEAAASVAEEGRRQLDALIASLL